MQFSSLGTVDSMQRSIKHIERIIAAKAATLRLPSESRNEHPDLDHFLKWLFQVKLCGL